jgi:hypothetical protein
VLLCAAGVDAVLDGEDLRDMPLGDHKKRLAGLIGRRRIGIVLSAHTGDDGAAIFQPAAWALRALCRNG